MKKTIVTRICVVAFLFSGLLMLSACKSEGEPEPESPDQESIDIRPEVVFTTVTDEPMRFYIESRGVAEPHRRSKIVTRLSGVVEEHKIEEGTYVSAGDTLLNNG